MPFCTYCRGEHDPAMGSHEWLAFSTQIPIDEFVGWFWYAGRSVAFPGRYRLVNASADAKHYTYEEYSVEEYASIQDAVADILDPRQTHHTPEGWMWWFDATDTPDSPPPGEQIPGKPRKNPLLERAVELATNRINDIREEVASEVLEGATEEQMQSVIEDHGPLDDPEGPTLVERAHRAVVEYIFDHT